jgi:hypothetical protein
MDKFFSNENYCFSFDGSTFHWTPYDSSINILSLHFEYTWEPIKMSVKKRHND